MSFVQLTQLNIHKNSYHGKCDTVDIGKSKNPRLFPSRIMCTFWEKYFLHIEKFIIHVGTRHSMSKDILLISKWFNCGELFENFMILTTHYETTHRNSFYNWKILCDFWGKSYYQSYIKNHVKFYHKIDLQKWKICQQIFMTAK